MLQFLAETYQLALRLSYTHQRGFHCSLKIPKNCETPSIPAEFIKVTKGRGMYSMTTDKLVGYTVLSIHLHFTFMNYVNNVYLGC